MLLAVLLSVLISAEPKEKWKTVEGAVVSVDVSPMISVVPLENPITKATATSREKHLVMLVVVHNQSDSKKINFRGWGANPFVAEAFLTDNLDNTYKMVSFGVNKITGAADRESIYPGKSHADLFAFEMPVDKAESFTLRLKGSNVGEEKELKLSFVRGDISIEAEKAAEPEKKKPTTPPKKPVKRR